MEPAVDLEATALQAKKSQVAMDTEPELARAGAAVHPEALIDTAPVLEGIKVIWITTHFHSFECKDSEHSCENHDKLLVCPSLLTLSPHCVS